mmetsp:Transcript_77955/g.215527  ORF Transcript_77955/g.215527 Transcript_77955/m.215527 type:complete len:226 (+) Transcript_77955:1104-1781(+)
MLVRPSTMRGKRSRTTLENRLKTQISPHLIISAMSDCERNCSRTKASVTNLPSFKKSTRYAMPTGVPLARISKVIDLSWGRWGNVWRYSMPVQCLRRASERASSKFSPLVIVKETSLCWNRFRSLAPALLFLGASGDVAGVSSGLAASPAMPAESSCSTCEICESDCDRAGRACPRGSTSMNVLRSTSAASEPIGGQRAIGRGERGLSWGATSGAGTGGHSAMRQ